MFLRSDSRSLQKVLRQTGNPDEKFHKSRKTFISTLLDANMNANTVREMVGHADERTTLQSYHFDRSTEDERVMKMEEALKLEDD
ncbi:MAG: tyrosine-type recombinase/integrase [Firmicutes bacterium]|nr:tyrosine-type recombinase/integrase [Bacillota bacterium]